MPYITPPTLGKPQRLLILLGGTFLACTAGYVNVVVLGTFAIPVSHMSGAFSRLGVDVATGNSVDLNLILLILAGFFSGAAISGAIIFGHQLKPGRYYGVTLMLESGALALAMVLLSSGSTAGVPVAALACGIQNGMASSYYGLIVRTTHVTGIVTDLGVLLGHRLRGKRVDSWKPILLLGLLVGFVSGCMLGQRMVTAYGPEALSLASAVTLIAGACYFICREKMPELISPPN